ncbi:hypothetical protein TNCV_755891 [Trichonephila clavipes]|nr:hypothetical protein TNCV_755891 [Trichonephila clavipes]
MGNLMAVGSKIFGLGSLPGMIHGDAHDFGIAAIPGNRGNEEFDGHWLAIVMKHVGMSKIGWLTQNRHVSSNSRMFLAAGGSLYIWSRSVTSEGITLAKAFSCERCTYFSKARFQGWRPTVRQGTLSSRCIFQSSNYVNHFTYTSATRGQSVKSKLYASVV